MVCNLEAEEDVEDLFIGTLSVNAVSSGWSINININVEVEDCGPCILGFQDIQRLKVAQMVGTIEQGKLIEEYRDVFRGIGCIPGEYQIKIDKKVEPVV
ncbi:hypothetical protein QE152_g5023 [Popillia japonica]|uniref:Uncharacterized protein n=1 Tax=Popillia japonica TaxID=7064 RepID=A0AAW1MUM7_POPJA